MAKTKEQKKEIVQKLEAALKGATSVFVHFTGVSVGQESSMRRALRGEGLGYVVAKKTLIRRALRGLGFEGDLPLEGEVAIAYTVGSEDTTAAPRRIHAFGQALGEGKLTILGGIFEKRLVDASAMQEIATIPSMPVLRGMFVNVINAPIAGLVVALQAIADKRSA